MTGAKKAQKLKIIDRVLCICYPVQFQKDKSKDVLALLDPKRKINAMILAYAAWLGFQVQKTNVSDPKIDKSLLKTYGMVIAISQVVKKLDSHDCVKRLFYKSISAEKWF